MKIKIDVNDITEQKINEILLEIEMEIHNTLQVMEQPPQQGFDGGVATLALCARYEALLDAKNIVIKAKNKIN